MWCIIYTVCAFPLIISLWWVGHKAKKAGALANYKTPYQVYGGKRLVVALFWQLDVIGIVLLILVFGFILVPFTVADGNSNVWKTGKIIAPLVIGIVLVPVWLFWESKAVHPMLPFHVSGFS
jgi:SIT family siderophore-iron:H+ symporter-like MFS transporter